MDELRLLPRLVAALVVGVALGIERERRRKPAGLRTHTVVCISCAALTAAAELLQEREQGAVIGDPVRMAQGILTGIGFIGAGTILRQQTIVIGVTTAATIWLSAAAGILCGAGFYILAVVMSLLALVAVEGMGWLAGWLRMHHAHVDLEGEAEEDE